MDKGGLLYRQKGDILPPLQPLLENAYFQQKSYQLDSPGRSTMNGLLLPNEESGAFTKSMSGFLEARSFTGKMVGREGGHGCSPGLQLACYMILTSFPGKRENNIFFSNGSDCLRYLPAGVSDNFVLSGFRNLKRNKISHTLLNGTGKSQGLPH